MVAAKCFRAIGNYAMGVILKYVLSYLCNLSSSTVIFNSTDHR